MCLYIFVHLYMYGIILSLEIDRWKHRHFKLSSKKLLWFIFLSQKCMRILVFLHSYQCWILVHFLVFTSVMKKKKESNFISLIKSRFKHLFKFWTSMSITLFFLFIFIGIFSPFVFLWTFILQGYIKTYFFLLLDSP